MSQVGENYRRLLERIEKAAVGVGRDPTSIRLVGATKRVDLARIREAIDSGLTEIGENRVQEAEEKIPLIGRPTVRCHLIGHLQANKVGKAVKLFSYIQTVDSVSLAQRLDRLTARRLSVLIQVKLENEPSKTGVLEGDLPHLVDVVQRSKHLDLQGLMVIPRFSESIEDMRSCFRKLRRKAQEFSLSELSMGMSHDFEVAIQEGATMVRVGTALFGER